jgi:hypothetical protein
MKKKQGRELIGRIEKAGGTVRITRRGHIQVKGPEGLTTVSAAGDSHRALANSIAQLARVGLHLRTSA